MMQMAKSSWRAGCILCLFLMLCVAVNSGFRFFFFFQAEDGIRDYKVTGVQTCALPIFLSREPSEPSFPEQKTMEPSISK